ncbi:hypothetical protein BOX17_11675 [Halomonas aestuarii]|uniref:Uncharacterized protein n=1 Tax=Halomonas aestuarii TaxID=1897729 RepID=A0A1J0VHN8_9GAMM|nr:hypothetical protein [Halomonas aestuarii]APE31547.1 hypothetical protein BOX17_11675 [Halomonas aestuarii]
MINTIQARVLGAMRYEIDNGTKGAKLTLMNEADPNNENRVGFEVMTISAPYEILDQLRAHAPHMPCNLEIDAEMRTTGGKMTMHALAVRKPSATGHSGSPAKADAKTA